MKSSYIGIDDAIGREVWADVSESVIRWVTVSEHDDLINTGFIDLDGRILLELDFSDG